MNTLTLIVTYGLGGSDPANPDANIAEKVTAEQAADGTWAVVTTTPDGSTSRPATADEAAGFNVRLNPPPPEPTVDDLKQQVADLQAQVDALQAQVNGTTTTTTA